MNDDKTVDQLLKGVSSWGWGGGCGGPEINNAIFKIALLHLQSPLPIRSYKSLPLKPIALQRASHEMASPIALFVGHFYKCVRMRAWVCVRMRAPAQVCLSVRVCVCVCMCVCEFVCLFVCSFVRLFVCLCFCFVCLCARMRVHSSIPTLKAPKLRPSHV